MDPFLIAKVAKARFFYGVKDTKGLPRKIKGYEKNVLMCVAANAVSNINLYTSFKQSAFKVKKSEFSYNSKTDEERLMEILNRGEIMTKAEIARQCSISFRRAMVIVDELLRIGALRHGTDRVGYVVNNNLLSSAPR